MVRRRLGSCVTHRMTTDGWIFRHPRRLCRICVIAFPGSEFACHDNFKSVASLELVAGSEQPEPGGGGAEGRGRVRLPGLHPQPAHRHPFTPGHSRYIFSISDVAFDSKDRSSKPQETIARNCRPLVFLFI